MIITERMDPDSDIYGRHAAGPDRPLGLPARFMDHEIVIPWSAFVYPGAAPATRHAATGGHPAGMYFERKGVVHHEPFSSVVTWLRSRERVAGVLPWSRVGALLRMNEKPLKKLTSQK